MRRRIFALAAAACLLLAGCDRSATPPEPSPSPTPGQTAPAVPTPGVFTLPLDAQGGWDPYVGSKSSNQALAPLLFEGLFQLDRRFDPQPVLAKEAVVSEEGWVWTVTLQEGVTFSDGTPLTAQTAGEALNAARGAKSLYAQRLKGVRQILWDREQTLTFYLTAPNARFPALLDVPIARVTDAGVFGTGPYRLGQNALEARQDWWQGQELPLETIPLLETADAGALISAFNAGEVSLVAADPTGADAMGYTAAPQSWEYPTTSMVYLGFQCGRGPCRSGEFRRAVSRLLDRTGLVGRVLEGHAAAAALPVPPAAADHSGELTRSLSYDPAAAGEALDELGYVRGEGGSRVNGRQSLALTLLVNSDNRLRQELAQAVAKSLESGGMAVEVKALSWEEYKKALEWGEFDLYLAECRLTGDLDPSPFLTAGSGLCYGGFYDQALTQALAQARSTGEWSGFYERWAETVPLAAICFKNAELLTQWGQVHGAEPTQGNLFYRFENWKIS